MLPFSNLFKREKAGAGAKVATSLFEPIISQALASRGSKPDDLRFDHGFKQPNYVVRMCQALHGQLQALGNTSATLADVVMLERTACGHVDYAHKLDLRLNQLLRAA